MNKEITLDKLRKYFALTGLALEKVKGNIFPGKEAEAKEIIDMASNYISDANHFKEKDDFVNAFGALNYAHGWIDSGVRLGIFNVYDDKLFTVK